MRYEYQNRTNPVKVNNKYPTVMKVNGRPVYRMKKTDKGLVYEESKIEAIPFNNVTNDNTNTNRGWVQNPPIFSGQSYSYPILASSDLIWKRYVQDLEFKYTIQHYYSGRPIVESFLYLTYGLNQTTPNYRKEGTLRNDDDIYHYAIYLNQLNTNNPKQIKYVNFPYAIEYDKSKRRNIPWYLSKIIPTYNSVDSQYLTYEINNHSLNSDPDNVYSFEYSALYSGKSNYTDDEIIKLPDEMFNNSLLLVSRLPTRRLNYTYINFTNVSLTDRNKPKQNNNHLNIIKLLKESFNNNQTININPNNVIKLKDIGPGSNDFDLRIYDNTLDESEDSRNTYYNNISSLASMIIIRLKVTNHLLNENKYYYFKANIKPAIGILHSARRVSRIRGASISKLVSNLKDQIIEIYEGQTWGSQYRYSDENGVSYYYRWSSPGNILDDYFAVKPLGGTKRSNTIHVGGTAYVGKGPDLEEKYRRLYNERGEYMETSPN